MDFHWAFTEIRLHPSAACRAWTLASGCHDAVAWDRLREELPVWRAIFESWRFQISQALAADGIDPLGVFRKLLIHESSASVSRSWLREAGFVHLDAASGIHLYCAWRACAYGLQRMETRGRAVDAFLGMARYLVPPSLWILIWGLTGFRPGLLRPFLLVGLRYLAERTGLRWAWGVPLALAIGIDGILGFLFSYGQAQTFAEWAPGELHYALSWWGGITAAEYGRVRGWRPLTIHFALSFGSWLAVLPLELAEGRFSVFTPFVSLLTIEVLARGGYIAFLGTAMAVGLGIVGAHEVLGWESFLWNQGVSAVAVFLTRMGGIRSF
jgi:hypothetical protein